MYPLFHPRKSKNTLVGQIIRTLIFIMIFSILGMLMLSLFPPLFRYKDEILERTFTMNMILIGLIIIGIIHFVFLRNKRKNQQIGNMSLHENYIRINGNDYPFEQIGKIRFIGNDIQGEFRGLIGYGQENAVFITLKNGQKMEFNFQQTTQNRLKEDIHLPALFKHDILSKANYDSILSNTNYY